MKQNLKKWLILILVFSYVITTKQPKEDEQISQDEVLVVEEEREQEVPEATSEPEKTAYGETEVTAYIKEVFGVDADYALRLAWCESRLNPNAVSVSGCYIGLFQFDEATFTEQCSGDIWNYRDQVDCTKKLIDRGEIWRWPNCP